MTVINNIEIDYIAYNRNEIKEAINNNDPIENKLHVIIPISNPCQYAIRYILTKEFINRIQTEEDDVILYIVELAYGNQVHQITKKNNPRHLQLRTEIPLWHKENMINVAVKKLLPKDWKAFAWIDADVEFENASWVKDTLKVLNGCKDVVQLYSHCCDMNPKKLSMSVFHSFGYHYTKGNEYCSTGTNFWHPGFAYACTRKAYEKMGGLYELGILGSGDNIMALSFIEKGLSALNNSNTDNYKKTVIEYQERVKRLRLGYIPGVILHHYHGSKQNRAYGVRWKLLVDYNYEPDKHLIHDKNGVLIPSKECPDKLLNDIGEYFYNRNEDENIEKRPKDIKMK